MFIFCMYVVVLIVWNLMGVDKENLGEILCTQYDVVIAVWFLVEAACVCSKGWTYLPHTLVLL